MPMQGQRGWRRDGAVASRMLRFIERQIGRFDQVAWHQPDLRNHGGDADADRRANIGTPLLLAAQRQHAGADLLGNAAGPSTDSPGNSTANSSPP